MYKGQCVAVTNQTRERDDTLLRIRLFSATSFISAYCEVGATKIENKLVDAPHGSNPSQSDSTQPHS